ncbi:hypothetical protein AC579_2960 [Pseudocercospora musae]|uniref:Uncharacterized protein n=1 Tax=Pseudocercospora musae TaxID=113226 RepID=A0A139I656_9PEZI|nr:hypothetical protein AC579_2960 [Pseudocercospora musae]
MRLNLCVEELHGDRKAETRPKQEDSRRFAMPNFRSPIMLDRAWSGLHGKPGPVGMALELLGKVALVMLETSYGVILACASAALTQQESIGVVQGLQQS